MLKMSVKRILTQKLKIKNGNYRGNYSKIGTQKKKNTTLFISIYLILSGYGFIFLSLYSRSMLGYPTSKMLLFFYFFFFYVISVVALKVVKEVTKNVNLDMKFFFVTTLCNFSATILYFGIISFHKLYNKFTQFFYNKFCNRIPIPKILLKFP